MLQGDATTIIQSTDCFHEVHIKCFKQRCYESKMAGTEVFCPVCNMQISAQEINAQLTEEDQKMIDQEQMNKLLADKDITSCPDCARVVMIVPG